MEEFEIRLPSPGLAFYIKHYWFLKTATMRAVQRIIPTGNLSLIFHRKEKLFSRLKGEFQPQAFICGQSAGYTDLEQNGAVDMIAVVFQPYAARAFFSLPLKELMASTVAINEIADGPVIELQNELMKTADLSLCVQLIESFLYKRLKTDRAYNLERMCAAVDSVANGEMNIENIAQTTCLSYKQFNRVFLDYVGLKPKEFVRVIRFQRALYTLQVNPLITFTQLALQCGYYDQSHLIKEFKILSGYNPGEYTAICLPYSDYFN